MVTPRPTISLIIRTWNEASYITQALDAVYGQSIRPDEIIVVDSGSSDDTIDKLKGYDVKLIEIPHERFTYGYSLNTGAKASEGDYLLSLSAHAIPANHLWLVNLTQPLLADPKIAGSASHQLPFPDQSLEPYLTFWQALHKVGVRTPVVKRYLFSNACSAFRSTLWRQTPFDETLMSCEDHLWALKMQRRGYSFGYSADSMVYHSHQLSIRVGARRRWRELLSLIDVYVPYSGILRHG